MGQEQGCCLTEQKQDGQNVDRNHSRQDIRRSGIFSSFSKQAQNSPEKDKTNSIMINQFELCKKKEIQQDKIRM